MPAKDLYHDVVITAMRKDGWKITDDPLHIEFEGVDFYIDAGAERLIAAVRGEEKIAVEIKSFNRASAISEFHTVLGQFMNYRLALMTKEADRLLYLAVPKDVYNNFFQAPFGQIAIRSYQLKLLVYDIQTEEITAWLT
ncbi:MAG: fatty-acid oxidation protein subunit alpha [Planctomycetes bacterium]|nr:fatty-acid oxidation protein subunit alpha [Planctomycetota bacterium]